MSVILNFSKWKLLVEATPAEPAAGFTSKASGFEYSYPFTNDSSLDVYLNFGGDTPDTKKAAAQKLHPRFAELSFNRKEEDKPTRGELILNGVKAMLQVVALYGLFPGPPDQLLKKAREKGNQAADKAISTMMTVLKDLENPQGERQLTIPHSVLTLSKNWPIVWKEQRVAAGLPAQMTSTQAIAQTSTTKKTS